MPAASEITQDSRFAGRVMTIPYGAIPDGLAGDGVVLPVPKLRYTDAVTDNCRQPDVGDSNARTD